MIKVAAVQYHLEVLANPQAFFDKQWRIAKNAQALGVQLLVFPEYHSLELVSCMDSNTQSNIQAQLQALQPFWPEFVAQYRQMAQELNMHIVAGSFPLQLSPSHTVNRCIVFSPTQHSHQDKVVMTRFERHWGISGGNHLQLMRTTLGNIGVITCYDAQFPLLAKQLTAAGADILVSPSCTEFETGYHRVMVGARARALENTCYVIHSPLVGDAPWSEALGAGFGTAGVYGPIDPRTPRGGIWAMGQPQQDLCLASLDLDLLDTLKQDGETLNLQDWPQSGQFEGLPVDSTSLF